MLFELFSFSLMPSNLCDSVSMAVYVHQYFDSTDYNWNNFIANIFLFGCLKIKITFADIIHYPIYRQGRLHIKEA